ncbi:MAG: ATPase [Spirochaetes bacterium]|nr:MAG: ATPase [Spirochaetota bacterium]
MRIAVPVVNGRLSPHFGHCQHFELADVDPKEKKILRKYRITAPEHQPGLLPRWLKEQGARVIIAGGMGVRARNLFAQNGIEVVVGTQGSDPEEIVLNYMKGTLKVGDNICDH